MSNPKSWKEKVDVSNLVNVILKEAVAIEVGGSSFVSSPEETIDSVVGALKSSGSIPEDSSPISVEDVPELAKVVCKHIDGKQEDGPVVNYFAKKWAVLKIENKSLFDVLSTGAQGDPTLGKSSAPSGTQWIMDIAGGPQPSIGRGELLFGLLHGLEAGDGGPEDADLKSGSTEYHVKYFADTSKAIKGPTNARASNYISEVFSSGPMESSAGFYKYVKEAVESIFTKKGTYNSIIDKYISDNPPPVEEKENEVKGIISWYVAYVAKNSLVRGEKPGEKFIVLITGDSKFQVEELSSRSLRLPPYPNRQESNGRISYNLQLDGPAQVAAAYFPQLIEATPAAAYSIVQQIASGEEIEGRQIVDIAGSRKSAGISLPDSLEAKLKQSYSNREQPNRSYSIGASDISRNAAWENYLKPLDSSTWPARGEELVKFLKNTSIAKSTKTWLLNNFEDQKVQEFLGSLEKIKSANEKDFKEKSEFISFLNESLFLSIKIDNILKEDLNRADKKEIDKMILKRIEADRVQQRKDFQANLQKELKSSKFQKAIMELANQELSKELKGKELQASVLEITKKVIKKLYRELSYSYNPVIDRIKL